MALNINSIFVQLDKMRVNKENEIGDLIAEMGAKESPDTTDQQKLAMYVNEWSLFANVQTNVVKTLIDGLRACSQNMKS